MHTLPANAQAAIQDSLDEVDGTGQYDPQYAEASGYQGSGTTTRKTRRSFLHTRAIPTETRHTGKGRHIGWGLPATRF